MKQRPENFNPAGKDPEATLVTPRFDETDARRAHPVVPLDAVPPRNAPRTTHVRAPRLSWTHALLAVALLLAAAVGGAVVTKFMQGPRAERAPEPTQIAPVQTANPPVQTAAAAPPQPSPPQTAEAPRAEVPAARPTTRDTTPRRARAESEVDEVERDEDGERRGRRAEKRRAREEEDVEKEMRKALKRAKGKAPRLVDVLTNSPER